MNKTSSLSKFEYGFGRRNFFHKKGSDAERRSRIRSKNKGTLMLC